MANTYTKLRSGEWGVRVEGQARAGLTVSVRRKDGQTREETIRSVVWSGNGVSLCSIVPRDTPAHGTRLPTKRTSAPKKRSVPKAPELVGESTNLTSTFEATKNDRKPHREIGEALYLKSGSERIPVVVVGYETASYVRSDDAEDMGHYGVRSGWYGTLYYRRATEEEAAALDASPAEVARREREELAARRAALRSTLAAAPRDTWSRTKEALPEGAFVLVEPDRNKLIPTGERVALVDGVLLWERHGDPDMCDSWYRYVVATADADIVAAVEAQLTQLG